MRASAILLIVCSSLILLSLTGCGSPQPPAAEAPKPEPKPEPPPPQPIALAAFQPLTLQPGGEAKVELKVERNGNEGPIEIKLGELPKGITVEAPEILAEESAGSLTVKAAQSLGDEPLAASFQVTASIGEQTASQALAVNVPKLNLPSLQPMAAVLLQPGTSKTVDVKLNRNGFQGAVPLRVEGATEKVQCKLAAASVENDGTTLEITAARDAANADLKIRVAATLFGRNIGAELPLKVESKPFHVDSFKVVTIEAGAKQRIELPIKRGSYKGSLQLTAEDLPKGVKVGQVEVAADATTAVLELEADPGLEQRVKSSRVVSKAGHLTDAGPQPEEALRAAGSCFSLRGDSTRTDAIFQAIDSTRDRSLRFNDLQLQLAVNPGNQAAIHELQQLATAGPVPAGIGAPSPPTPAPAPASRASQLYSLHCSACHGTNGDGKGHAARHLFPRPRDFRTDRFRLASTANGAPTLEDLERVNRQGMPGTTMLAFEDFTDEEHRLLAGEVMRLVKEGVREEYARALQQEGEEIDEVDLGEVAQLATTPGELIAVPPIGPADPQTIAAGKDHYVEWSCTKCHGDDGTGPSDEPLYDDQGRPTVARDLVHDPMRGGPEDASLYLRLRLGMPGTPHPACPNVSERQLIELLHYCRCLAREPKRILTSHEQRLAATMRPQPAAIVSTKSP